MGYTFTDAYSLLHFATAVVARHWAIGFWTFIILHTVFELSENTKTGMWFINTYLKAWPGGKSHADTWLNIFGDTVYAALGWIAADWSLRHYK